MPTIVLETDRSELVGFLLVAGASELNVGADSRDGILTGFPQDPALLEHPLADIIQRYKHVEFRLASTKGADETRISGSLPGQFEIDVVISAGGVGTWRMCEGGTSASGTCRCAT
jgi:hypothetical protein